MAITDDNKAIVRRFIDEVWNKNNRAVADELLHEKFVVKGAAYKHKEGEKHFVAEHRKAFPDMHYTVTHIVAEGDMVAVQIEGKGTHRGHWQGVAPTGNKVTVRGDAKMTVKHGKITEAIHNVDLMGIRIDMGVLGDVVKETPVAGAAAGAEELKTGGLFPRRMD